MSNRQRFCRVCHDWHDPEHWPAECWTRARPARSYAVPLPNFRRDHMDELMHPGDGNTYTSRSDYDAVTKAKNLIEVGDCSQKENIELDIVQKSDVMEAAAMVAQGYKPNVATATTGDEGWQ